MNGVGPTPLVMDLMVFLMNCCKKKDGLFFVMFLCPCRAWLK